MSDIRQTADRLPNELPWEKYFMLFFKHSYQDLKEYDKHNVLSFNLEKLEDKFISTYSKYYEAIKEKIELPDRHKVIAIITKAFLEISPFECNTKKLAKSIYDGHKPSRGIAFPNEFIATKICKIVLTAHGRHIKEDAFYNFKYPDLVYVYAKPPKSSNYEYELFTLYRHYTNTIKQGKGQFSIYQMASLYFALEMGYDIAKYGTASLYYK